MYFSRLTVFGLSVELANLPSASRAGYSASDAEKAALFAAMIDAILKEAEG